MPKRKKFDSPDQLDIFTDRTFEIVETNKDLRRTPKEELQKKILMALGNLGLGPDFLEDDFEKLFYVFDKNVVRHKVEARLYALETVYECVKSNSFVRIETGLGKTYIELLTALYFLKYNKVNKKILILATSKPLCRQHRDKANEIFLGINTEVITGDVSQKKRREIWDNNQIIVATPQTITREVKKGNGIGRPEDIQLVIFDEVHKMVGNYDYVTLANLYSNYKDIRLTGFTGSLDSDPKKLEEILKIMGLKFSNIIAKTENSPDVAPYVFKKNIYKVGVKRHVSPIESSLMENLRKEFRLIIKRERQWLKMIDCDEYGFLGLLDKSFYKDEEGLEIAINIKWFEKWNKEKRREGLKGALDRFKEKHPKDTNASLALRDWGLLFLFHTAITMLEKGVHEFRAFLESKYFENISKKPSQYAFRLNRAIVESIKMLCRVNLWTIKMSYPVAYHPENASYNWSAVYRDAKLHEMEKTIRMYMSSQILIFVNYRDTLDKVVHYLKTVFPEKNINKFIGQTSKSKDKGMTQKSQNEILKEYRNGQIDILVATLIGEEGLNFPAVDVVFFYEPITDPRRIVQRVGRTGRYRDGDVFILFYEGEKEELIVNIGFAKSRKAKEIAKFYEKYGDHF